MDLRGGGIKRHIAYLKYVMRHKWFVFRASIKIKSSLWLAIVHDWSKFKPSEWIPYANTFYEPDGSNQYKQTPEFAQAWNKHQKSNKHHWQFWMLTWDRGETIALPMPQKYVLEMIADWMGAGKAITGKWEIREWYYKNKDKIILESSTRDVIEKIIDKK